MKINDIKINMHEEIYKKIIIIIMLKDKNKMHARLKIKWGPITRWGC
jgi:hypothetical protein